MRYALLQLVLARNAQVEIDKQRYYAIAKARLDLTELTPIEEKFDTALENHYELEKEVTAIAARDMMFSEITEISLWNIGNLLNRRVINVLSSCRAYLDHTSHHLNNVFGEGSDVCLKYKLSRAKQYDAGYEFRIVEAMRNYGQHRGLPIHGWSLRSQKVYHRDEMELEYRVGFKIIAKNLREDGKFKSKALNDIDELGGSADLLAVLRGYVEALSEIHCELREATKPRINEIEDTLTAAINDYKATAKSEDSFVGLAVAILDVEGVKQEHHYIVPAAIEYRRYFVIKNRKFGNFRLRHVSSRSARDREGK